MPNAKNLGGGLYELRGTQIRIFYCFRGRRIVLLDGTIKKRMDIPDEGSEEGSAPHGQRRVKGRTMTKKPSRWKTRTAGGVIERLDALAAKDNPAAQRRVDEMLAKILIRNDLIRLREKRGITQKQLAGLMGVSQPLIAQLESTASRNIELRTLVRAAVALGAEIKVELREMPKDL